MGPSLKSLSFPGLSSVVVLVGDTGMGLELDPVSGLERRSVPPLLRRLRETQVSEIVSHLFAFSRSQREQRGSHQVPQPFPSVLPRTSPYGPARLLRFGRPLAPTTYERRP